MPLVVWGRGALMKHTAIWRVQGVGVGGDVGGRALAPPTAPKNSRKQKSELGLLGQLSNTSGYYWMFCSAAHVAHQ